MQAITVATRLDWSGWLLGIMGAVVSGFGGVIGSGLGVSVIDPKDFNFANGLGHLVEVTVISGLISAAVSLGKFLQTHPTPGTVTDSLNMAADANQQAGAAIADAQAKDASK